MPNVVGKFPVHDRSTYSVGRAAAMQSPRRDRTAKDLAETILIKLKLEFYLEECDFLLMSAMRR